MKQLTTINVENENYHIFKVESKEGILEIYFIWGKTDFRSAWLKKDVWIKKSIEIYKNSKWYEYQGISNHGILLEETHWRQDTNDLYIDLPKNFAEVVSEIFKKVSPKYYI